MSDQLLQNLVATIGGPESPAGSAEARTKRLPISGLPGYRENAEMVEDPVITGVNITRGQITVAKNLLGSMPLAPRCNGGFGMALNSHLGQELTPTQIGGCLRVKFTGSEASAKLSANTSGDTFSCETGVLGSETDDAEWGGGSPLDLTDPANDTLAELIAVIEAYTDFSCEKVFGADALDTADIIDIVAQQGKDHWTYVFFSSAASGFYLHTWPVVLTNTQRPTYSVQLDEEHDNYLYTGSMVNQMALSAALKGLVEAGSDWIGFVAAGSAVASSVAFETADPLIFSQGSFMLKGVEYSFTRRIEMTTTNNSADDGYGMGSLSRQYHRKALFGITGRVGIRFDSDNAATLRALRTGMFTDAIVGMSMFFQANKTFDGTTIVPGTPPTAIPQMMLVEVPYGQITTHEPEDNSGVLDASMDFVGTMPDGQYGAPLTVSLITADSAAY